MNEPWEYDGDWAYHAPSEYVEQKRQEREERNRRDRTELREVWRDEVQRRRRERAPLFYRTSK